MAGVMFADGFESTIRIEYDWIVDARDCGAHTHRPSDAVLRLVALPFERRGIRVIQDRSDAIPEDAVASMSFTQIKVAYTDHERWGRWHYVLIRHGNGGGWANINGWNATVFGWCGMSDEALARSILHELGHNLGLRHGGFENCNGKPNYPSVMNYRFANGRPDCAGLTVLDFSDGTMPPLDEGALDERVGLCGTAADWNGDGQISTGVVADLNPSYNATCGGTYTVLRDHADWSALDYSGTNRTKLAPEIVVCP